MDVDQQCQRRLTNHICDAIQWQLGASDTHCIKHTEGWWSSKDVKGYSRSMGLENGWKGKATLVFSCT